MLHVLHIKCVKISGMTQYVCSSCGFSSASWYGKCPECREWNSFKKFTAAPANKGRNTAGSPAEKAAFTHLSDKQQLSGKRLQTGIHEFDRVLGGGFITGEAVLIAGEPGVGKSTMLLSMLSAMNIIYISGEESAEQVRQRADRTHAQTDNIRFSNTIEIDSIIAALEDTDDDFDAVVIDSVQTMHSDRLDSPMGSVSQIKETAARCVEWSKRSGKIVIIVGHVTKEGDIAGPKMLEHLVDCVLYLEGEKESHFRILRARKNRFGPTDEVGIFAMTDKGLEQVDKPEALIDSSTDAEPGRSIVISVEGSRALYYEIQCLVVPTQLAVPRRVVSGIDYNRLQLLLAVMRKHMSVHLDTYDIYINVVGGLTAKTPAADLGIIAAVYSSAKNTPLPAKSAFIGEIGLLGEVRSVYRQDKAIQEARRFGLKKIYSSKDIRDVKGLKKAL